MPQNILIVVTSANRTLTGEPTGTWMEEVAVPYNTSLKLPRQIAA
jgi:hypothetical protein